MGFLLDFSVEFIIKLAKTMTKPLLNLQKQELELGCKNDVKKEHNKEKNGQKRADAEFQGPDCT